MTQMRPPKVTAAAGSRAPAAERQSTAQDPAPVAPPTPERCRLLLQRWRADLDLSPREGSQLAPELAGLDRQLARLEQRRPRVAVFGRVGVGKSSLLNALVGEASFATDVAHGSTRHQQARPWQRAVPGLAGVELVDTPGIDEIAAAARARLAARVVLGSDLVLLVLDADLGRVEIAPDRTMNYTDKAQKLTIKLEGGLQWLGGQQLEGLLRFRDKERGEEGRRQRQQLAVESLLKQMGHRHQLQQLPNLITKLQNQVDTNLTHREALSLLAAALQQSEPVRFRSLPLKPPLKPGVPLRQLAPEARDQPWPN